ncbi:MAG: uroporphyrinogen methyltransferase / synthase, partial [Solirubrobacterales bacterium]|nr:uroporphyrinogen methyltransferase / synthase [Solirubrobacterales bacterium]
PDSAVAEALAIALGELELEGRRALVARAAQAREVIPDALRDRGAAVDVIALYETRTEAPDAAALAAAEDADYVTFTASSTVRNLLDAFGGRLPAKAKVVSIGPTTSASARDAGLEVAVEAARHDVDGLIEALLADALSPPP